MKKKKKHNTMMESFLSNIQFSRRTFIKASATTGAAVALGVGLKPELKALASAQGTVSKGLGEWRPATCQGCTSWCSKQVYVIDGRAVKVRGNSHSKVNQDAGCPRSHMSLQQVYDPQQLIASMLRVGRKAVVSFPNFGHWRIRTQLLFAGRSPITEQLPYQWYDSPNIRVLSIRDFRIFARAMGMRIVREVATSPGRTASTGTIVRLAPNLMATYGIFLLEKDRP